MKNITKILFDGVYTMDFTEFKNRNKTKNFEEKQKEMNSINKGNISYEKDERIWKLEMDKSCNGYAIIRYLPVKNPDSLPVSLYYEHSFEHNGYYIENCPTSISKPCPMCEDNKQYWGDNATQADKNFARPRSRKKKYVANILVVDDPAHPENNGKVFLFKFGKQIKDKIDDKYSPKNERETPIDIFDMWGGCNFTIKTFEKKTDFGSFPSYENSSFESPSQIGDDNEIESIFNQIYSLDEFTDPSNYKSYDELEKRVKQVCYGEQAPKSISDKKTKEEEPEPEKKTSALPIEEEPKAKAKAKPEPEVETEVSDEDSDEEDSDDSDANFFDKFKS